MLVQIDVRPVIEAGALHGGFIGAKAERFDQMESRAGGRAKTRNIARVGMYLWFI